MEYRRSSHAVFGLQYHIVLVTNTAGNVSAGR